LPHTHGPNTSITFYGDIAWLFTNASKDVPVPKVATSSGLKTFTGILLTPFVKSTNCLCQQLSVQISWSTI